MSSAQPAAAHADAHADAPDDDAAVFAASAAEGALLDSKTPPASDDLAASIDRAAASVAAVRLEEESKPVEPAAASATDAIPSPEQLEQQLDADLNLSKEEMVEAALDCPCIASMRDGPCGNPFIAAYRCFLESDSEPRGMECIDQFREMQTCIADHPDEYNFDEDEEDARETTAQADEHQPPHTPAASDPDTAAPAQPQPAVAAASAPASN